MASKFFRNHRSLSVAIAMALVLAVFSLVVFRKQITGKVQEQKPIALDLADAPAQNSAANRSSFLVSQSPTDKVLQRSIDEVINAAGSTSGRWGVFVTSLRDGRVLYARDADQPFVPASNMKLFPTAVALDLLGAGYEWRTSVYAKSFPNKDGNIESDLVLYGRGAPDLTSFSNGGESSLQELADNLYKGGLRRVRGNVVGDESFFRGEPLGDGWLWNDLQWYYGAEVSALSINGNQIGLVVSPGSKPGDLVQLKSEALTQYVQIANDALTVERGAEATIGITRGLSDNVFRIWGTLPVKSPAFMARLSVHQPALLASRLFRDELKAHGIQVEGEATTSSSHGKADSERFDPQSNVELASLTSKSLKEVTSATNKESLNLEAELIFRTLGKEKGAMVPDPNPLKMNMRGDDAAAGVVIIRWLEQEGISTKSLDLHDGSGLSHLNTVTPEIVARLLEAMAKTAAARDFRDSLPTAGRDGTLRNRLRSKTGRVFAKTGTLTHVNSLSGYVEVSNGDLLSFSIIYNGTAPSRESSRIIDQIADVIATANVH